MRSEVRVLSGPPHCYASTRPHDGGIAQLVERQLCKLEVRSSNLLASTTFIELTHIIRQSLAAGELLNYSSDSLHKRDNIFVAG